MTPGFSCERPIVKGKTMAHIADIASWLIAGTLPVLLVFAAVSDIRSLQIPNSIPIAITGLFALGALSAGLDVWSFGQHYAIGLGVLVAGAGLFAMNVMGGGDVKLLAAASIWFEWTDLFGLLLMTAIFGGVLALLVLVMRRFRGAAPFATALPWMAERGDDGSSSVAIPYGVAISAAAIYLFPRSPLVPASWAAAFGG